MEERRLSDFQIYRRLLQQARPLALALTAMFVLKVLAAPLALLTPLPLKMAVDHVIGNEPLPWVLDVVLPESVEVSKSAMLIAAVGLVILITVMMQAHNIASYVGESYLSKKLVLEFRARLFSHAQRLSLLYHDRKGTGDSLYRIQYDAPAIEWILVHSIPSFLTSAGTVVAMVWVISQINVQLAVVALIVMPILFGLAEFHRRRVRTRWREVKNVEAATMSVLEETFGAMRVVKAFGQEERQQAAYMSKADLGVRRHVFLAFLDGSFGALVGLVVAGGTASALYFGIHAVQGGSMTIGQLLLVMAYITQLYTPMKTMSSQIGSMQGSMASAERAFALLDETPDVVDPPHGRNLARAEGGVEFRDVSFGYEADHRVLSGISFQVEPGARVGIAGTTGAGKTTLVSLLTRLYDPTAGQVRLDDVDVREFKLADLRNQFAVVLQEPVLFSNSIAENIAYARPNASEADIIEAAQAANAHDFIMQLPNGYQTLVGQRGARLSGGERQRISLARAFLKDAPILVLDEPTSSVDVKTEAAIMDAMDRLMINRTTFMIAHRLSTLENCDVRLHLEKGHLVVEKRTETAPVLS